MSSKTLLSKVELDTFSDKYLVCFLKEKNIEIKNQLQNLHAKHKKSIKHNGIVRPGYLIPLVKREEFLRFLTGRETQAIYEDDDDSKEQNSDEILPRIIKIEERIDRIEKIVRELYNKINR